MGNSALTWRDRASALAEVCSLSSGFNWCLFRSQTDYVRTPSFYICSIRASLWLHFKSTGLGYTNAVSVQIFNQAEKKQIEKTGFPNL